eukprot:TRINITY_DN8501_c0_g5_i1.p1 TRINITY_DN8501_c0_g5~~TRINITY_DN8501_c0_g5_i1.p1  ORF type:complete len:1096 (+),score=564.00 TRINITY_DN8501_c0_g5_i1:481-3288(+)
MELLFTQNREFMDEFEVKLKATQDQSLRDTEHLELQLAAIREALHMGDRQQDADLKGTESRFARLLKSVQMEASSSWECLAAAMSSPLPIESLGDSTVSAKVGPVRDAVLNAIAMQVSQAVDVLRSENDERSKQQEGVVKRLQGMVQRSSAVTDTISKEFKEGGRGTVQVSKDPALMDKVMGQVERQVGELTTKLTSQQLNVVDIDRRLTDKVKGLSELFSHLEGNVAKLGEDSRMNTAGVQEVMAQCHSMQDGTRHAAEEARMQAAQFQEQCNEVLQRHVNDVRERLQQQQEETRAQLQVAGEKSSNAGRMAEMLRMQMEEFASATKRAQAQVHEAEAARKEEMRRLQQQSTDAVARVQQLASADVHRLQKEISQEMQRYEDAASSLYRTVEELRGVQQRTLEEYHRQGDEQAMVHAKFQQQLTDVNSVLKEQLQTESERLQNLLRTESQGLNDQVVRFRTELSERVGAVERRMGDTDNVIDSFRGRIRTLEMNDSTKLEKTVFELKQLTQQHDNRVHSLEGWRTETMAKLTAMEGRIAEAGNAAQLAALGRKRDDLERGLILARGPEKEELRRQLKGEIDERVILLEGQLDSNFEGLVMRINDQENLLKDVQRDNNRHIANIKKNTEAIANLDSDVQDRLKKMKETIASDLEPGMAHLSNQIKTIMKELRDTRDYCHRLDGLIKNRDGKAAEMLEKFASEFEEMKNKFGDQLAKSDSKLEEVKKFIATMRDEFAKMKRELDGNSAADEERAQHLTDLILRECGKMNEHFQKMFQDMKDELAKNNAADEVRSNELNRMVDEYSREFTNMRDAIEQNSKEDENREKMFQALMDDLMSRVDSRNKEAAEKMSQIHELAGSMITDMQHELQSWRDRVASSESQIKELQGYVEAMSREQEKVSLDMGSKINDIESNVSTEMGKMRRAFEKVQANLQQE